MKKQKENCIKHQDFNEGDFGVPSMTIQLYIKPKIIA